MEETLAQTLALAGALLGLVLNAGLGFLFPAYQDYSMWSSSSRSVSSTWGYETDEQMVPFEEIDGTGMLCYPAMPYNPVVLCEPGGGPGDMSFDEGDSPSSWADDDGGWGAYPWYLLEMEPLPMLLYSVASNAPHSGSVLEIFTSGGLALFVIGISMLVARPLRWVLLPLSAVGAMPLSAYTLHALILLALTGPGGYLASNLACLLLLLGLVLACTAWAVFAGRGPLERLAAWSSRWFSHHPAP